MWNERYSEEGFAYGTAPNDFLVEQRSRLPSNGTCLALADGEGRNGVWLAGLGLEVTAVDLSEVGLTKAKRLAEEAGVRITTQVADLGVFDLGEASWDAIVSIWAHVPAPLRASLHARVVRALRPGGVFVLEAYTPAQIALGTGGPKDPSMLMTLAGLREELAGLEIENGEERERMIDEGKYHQGKSAVVRLVARKPSA